MGYQERDLRDAALFFNKHLLDIKQGERLLIYVDQGSDYYAAKVIQESAAQIGALIEFVEINPNQKLPDMSGELMDVIEKRTFDAICELSEQTFYETPPWQKALRLGSRIYSLSGLNADAFIRCIRKVNHNLMLKFGMELTLCLKKAKSIQIITKKGTDIKFQMDTSWVSRSIPQLEMNILFQLLSRIKRKLIPKLKKARGSYIVYPSGNRKIRGGQCTFMGGQLGFQGIPQTIKGTAVIDGYLWPPHEIGLIDVPIILKIKKGNVIKINGCPSKSKILKQWIGGNAKEIQHFCIGFNPGANLSGQIMEAERVFGYISIGIGEYPFHTDGIMKNPSIILDNETIEQDGSFINEKLSILERDLMKGIQN